MSDNADDVPQPMETTRHDPRILEELHIPVCLEVVLDMQSSASAHAAKARVERLLEQARQTDDPVEAMMLEQLCLAHHRIASLHARAATATDIKVIEVYSSAAQRLLGEWRRLVLALRDYRTPVQGRSTTIIHRVEQLNAAESQDVSYTKQDSPEGGTQLVCRDTELTSNKGEEPTHDYTEQRARTPEEPPAGRRWQAEQGQAKRPFAPGPTASPRGRAQAPAVAALDGAEDPLG